MGKELAKGNQVGLNEISRQLKEGAGWKLGNLRFL